MTPQFTYDSHGNAIGVFLPIEDWNQIKNNLLASNELPQWQKDILDQRMMHIRETLGCVWPLDDFIAQMEREVHKDV